MMDGQKTRSSQGDEQAQAKQELLDDPAFIEAVVQKVAERLMDVFQREEGAPTSTILPSGPNS